MTLKNDNAARDERQHMGTDILSFEFCILFDPARAELKPVRRVC